jgi:ADP-ribose pyrophosphatase
LEDWKTIKTEKLLDTQWIKVYKDAVELPNGMHVEDFYKVGLNDASAIVGMDNQKNIILVKQYRYCCGCCSIEIPAGTFEMNDDDGLEVVKRELLEETGYVSDCWQYLGSVFESSAKLTNQMHLYFASNCRKIGKQNLDEVEEIQVIVVPFEKAIEMVMDNEIRCSSSANGILRVARLLGK